MTAIDTNESLGLLVRLLRRDTVGIERCLQARPDALDELAVVAAESGLAVVLLRALGNSPWMQNVSTRSRRALAERRDRQVARCEALERGLAHVAGLFDAAGLGFMLLKGPYLAARFYGDPRGREFRDLDVLIRRADRQPAFRVLERAGYARRSRVLGSEALTTFFVHGFDFVADGVNLDLHWCLSRHPSIRVDEFDMWKRRGTFRLGSRSYDVLSDEHEVMLGVLALLRDIERGRLQIKNVVDLVQIVAALDGTMTWNRLFAESRLNGVYGPMVNVLLLCLDLAGARDLAPRLAGTLAEHAGRWVHWPAMRPSADSTARRLSNRLWAARSHDTAFGTWLGWWALSLPFRRAAHGWPRPIAAGATTAR